MNVLFLTLLYHPREVPDVTRYTRDGLQTQINAFQWALIDGLKSCLGKGETLSILNSLPVGVFPIRYRKLILRTKRFSGDFLQIGSVNLPWLKQRGRFWHVKREISRWAAASPENRTILLYTPYLPYLQAVEAVKKRTPDLKAAVIVTDLPNELGISSGRTGLLKKIEYRIGRQSMALCAQMDGFALLTAPMTEALSIHDKPWIVVEGLVADEPQPEQADLELPVDDRPVALYTGTLNRELGVAELLTAFEGLNSAQLWLCGRGDMEREVRAAAQAYDNICYFGFVPRQTALALQARADLLVNPRTAQGTFTRYSFPSKTLEYMRSGKPVICCKLEGIPDEYDEYLRYASSQNAQGLRDAVIETLALPKEQRHEIGMRARAFALTYKNSHAQGERILALLRKIGE